MQDSFDKKIRQATKWSSLAEIATKLVAPITNVILARLLMPEVFGVVATLTMVVSFAELFTDAGFQKYLVQHEFQNKEDLEISTNVAFWTNFVLSVLIWVGISFFAIPIANMTGVPGCENAIIVMAFEIPILALSSIQMARYRRDMDFKNLFIVRVLTALVPLVVTVPLAFFFKSYWALVAGTLARDVVNALILTVKSRWKPKFVFNFRMLKEMLSFSIWSMVENISVWLTGYVGTFVVGSMLNAYYLGLYKTTISTIASYLGLVTSATTPVLFSAMSRCQDDDNALLEVYYRFQRLVALLVFPLGFGMCIYRRLVTQILLGSQWLETADFMGIWALMSAITVVFSHYNSEVFRSKGKPKLSVLVQVLHLVVLVPALIWSASLGFRELTIVRTLIRLQLILVSIVVLRILMGVRFIDIMKNVWPSVVASVVMTCAGVALRAVYDNILWEIFTVLFCVLVYGLTLLVLPAGRRQLAEVPILNTFLKLNRKTSKK